MMIRLRNWTNVCDFRYLAPEYASSGKLTDKSDVFSYGVMLLELVTGRRPVDITNYEEDCLVDWVCSWIFVPTEPQNQCSFSYWVSGFFLLEQARPLLAKALEDGNYAPLADPRLEGNFDQDEMARMAACAAASIRHSAKRRPKMSQVILIQSIYKLHKYSMIMCTNTNQANPFSFWLVLFDCRPNWIFLWSAFCNSWL